MDFETLIAEREIARAIHQFARAMDERDWGALDTVMTEDATADLGMGALGGRANIVEFIRSFLDECGPTQHLIGNLVVDVDGDRATSRCYVRDMHQGAGGKAHLDFSTLGEYHDRWVRRNGKWWMTHRHKLNHAHLGSIEVLGPGPR
ncbi:MAG: hypothetical protein CMLOHMNK_00969 [Steroidobacteraceae bacterium]|nr:hypothetical protein [Steroidobacteraceae bacterium]